MGTIPPEYAVDTWDGNKWIIFCDEFTQSDFSTQRAFMRVIHEHKAGEFEFGPDTWVLAAANPPEMATGGNELGPPMANRVVHLQWEFDEESWHKGMCNGLNFPEPIFPVLPDNWRTLVYATGPLVSTFHKVQKGRLCAYPTDQSKTGEAWSSPRSQAALATVLAAARSVHATKAVEYELVKGCAGEGFAGEFVTWEDRLDLQDPEELITEGRKVLKKGRMDMKYDHPDRPDKVIATLGAVVGAILSDMSPERWDAGMLVIQRAAEFEMDVALACVGNLARAVPKGHKLPDFFVDSVYPKIRDVLVN